MSETKKVVSVNAFTTRINAPGKGNFDKYYKDVEVKEVYRRAGVDSDGEEFGVIENKVIVHKRDIAEFINSQADTVGVEAYMRALLVQGESIDDYNTSVDQDKVVDYSELPETLADTLMLGDNAKAAFANLDPALKGGHTTIEGFLNSLSKDTIDQYIKGKVDAAFPKEKVVSTEGGAE